MNTEQRFWAKVDQGGPLDCWIWTAAKTQSGYGHFHDGSVGGDGAHRYSYRLQVGPIPDGMTVDHLCQTPACVNPAHMELVTLRENILRGNSFSAINARKTHCKYGHPFNEENSYRNKKGLRICRACRRAREKRIYYRKKGR